VGCSSVRGLKFDRKEMEITQDGVFYKKEVQKLNRENIITLLYCFLLIILQTKNLLNFITLNIL